MANPASAASHDDEEVVDDVKIIEIEETDNTEPTFEAKVNSIVDNITRDVKGQYVLPDGLSEAEKFSAIAEKRRRDTQSSFTKAKQKEKQLEAEKAALLKRVAGKVTVTLTTEQAEELEELKFSNPEAWRKKVNAYEALASTEQQKAIDEELTQVTSSTLAKEELERRVEVLTEFNLAHPDVELTDDIIGNDIPPRIIKRLETGAVSFEAFLQECYDYTKTGKVIKQGDKPLTGPNLSKVGGNHNPDGNAVKKDAIKSYNNEIY